MSLCISYRTTNGKAVTLSDSLLTTVRKKEQSNNDENESASFLPSDQEILHQTPYGIKVQILSQKDSLYSSRFDVVVSIAGNVSLGLQSLLHLDAILQGTSFVTWAEHVPWKIEEKIRLFWNNARDQSLQMSFVINDHKGRTKIYELNAENGIFDFFEVEEENGVLVSVIGDGSIAVREKIFQKVNSLMYSDKSLNEIIHIAAVETLVETIRDHNSIFIGGSLQGAIFNHYLASYLKIHDDVTYFRGAEIESYESDLLSLPTLDLNSPDYPITMDGGFSTNETFTI